METIKLGTFEVDGSKKHGDLRRLQRLTFLVKRTTGAAGYQGPVKIELITGERLLVEKGR